MGSARGHGPGRSCMRCVRLRCRSALVFQSVPQDAAHGVPVGLHRFACATAPRAFAASYMHPQHPPRVPPRFAHCGKTEHMPHETRPSSPHPRKSSPSTGLPAAYPRKSSPNTAPPAALPRKNSPSKPKNINFGVFSARWANFFAHRTQRRGELETNDASATTDAGHRETTITTAHPSTATLETNNTSATAKHTKTPISHPQRRRRFQLRLDLCEHRRH